MWFRVRLQCAAWQWLLGLMGREARICWEGGGGGIFESGAGDPIFPLFSLGHKRAKAAKASKAKASKAIHPLRKGVTFFFKVAWGGGSSSGAECLSCMCETLGSILAPKKKQNKTTHSKVASGKKKR